MLCLFATEEILFWFCPQTRLVLPFSLEGKRQRRKNEKQLVLPMSYVVGSNYDVNSEMTVGG